MDQRAPSLTERVRADVGEDEWAARVDLAACYRLVYDYGWADMIANHISARAPGAHEHFLINAYGMTYDEMTASCFLKLDLDGNEAYNPTGDYHANQAGFVIHSCIHHAKPEIGCIIHTHSLAGMAVSAMECGLLPITQMAMRFDRVAYHDYEGVAIDLAEQERFVRDLGDQDAMILRNHGLLVVGRTIPEAFNTLYRLERACASQVMAMSSGTKLRIPGPDLVEKTAHQYRPHVRRRFGLMEWPALLRRLDRQDPGFRD